MRIRAISWSAFLGLCLGAIAVAAADETPPSLDGNWSISGKTNRGAAINGKLTLNGMQGVWFTQLRASSVKDTCLGREYPLEIQSVDDKVLVFIVKRDASLKGCADMSIKLRRAGPNLLEAGSDDGAHLKIER